MRIFINISLILSLILLISPLGNAQEFNGLDMNMGNLSKLSTAKTRSISPENFTGEKGKGAMADPGKKGDIKNVANAAHAARELGKGWKVNPFIRIAAGETFTLAQIEGSGAIQHIWMTATGNWSHSIIRMYWDDEKTPSVEAPIGAFFGMAWGEYAPLNSMAMAVNPGSAFNSYWKMPFRKGAKITFENSTDEEMVLYYQIDYTETKVASNEGYFHAQYRRSHPTENGLHTILDGVRGEGHYVGTYLAVGINNKGWWGEGEVKFYMDGDDEYPTIPTTGLEDYFGGSYNFENKKENEYEEFSHAYTGLHQVIRPDGLYDSQPRFGMYRWHIMDPVRFQKDLKVTVQDLGWRSEGRYLRQKSDIISVAYWYQKEPHATFPTLPEKDELEVN